MMLMMLKHQDPTLAGPQTGTLVGRHFRRPKFNNKFNINNEKYIILIVSMPVFYECSECWKNVGRVSNLWGNVNPTGTSN